MPLFANNRKQIQETLDHAERARLGYTPAQWKIVKAERKAAEDAAAREAYRRDKHIEAMYPFEEPTNPGEIDFLAMLDEIAKGE